MSEWHLNKEKGSLFLLKFLFILHKALGTKVSKFIVLFPALFYFIFSRKTRNSSKQFLSFFIKNREILPSSLKHIYSFGTSMIDSVDAWLGRFNPKNLYWTDRNILLDSHLQKKGGIFIGAHFGNTEVLRAISSEIPNLTINAIMYLKEAEKFRSILKACNEKAQSQIIALEKINPTDILDLQSRLDQGEYIALLGDRPSPLSPNKIIQETFLERSFDLPEGPFILATILTAPIFFIFCYRDNKSRYKIHSKKIILPEFKRDQKIKYLANEYVKELEKCVKESPFEWFNFH